MKTCILINVSQNLSTTERTNLYEKKKTQKNGIKKERTKPTTFIILKSTLEVCFFTFALSSRFTLISVFAICWQYNLCTFDSSCWSSYQFKSQVNWYKRSASSVMGFRFMPVCVAVHHGAKTAHEPSIRNWSILPSSLSPHSLHDIYTPSYSIIYT